MTRKQTRRKSQRAATARPPRGQVRQHLTAQAGTAPTLHDSQFNPPANGSSQHTPDLSAPPAYVQGRRGRQSSYTRDRADAVIRGIESGSSLRHVAADTGVPMPTICRWVSDSVDGFAERYAQAKAIACDLMAEDTIAIADDSSQDWETRFNRKGEEYQALNREHVERSKARIHARHWYLSRLAPKKYGDRVQQDVNVTVNVPALIQEGEAKLAKVEREAIEGEVIPD